MSQKPSQIEIRQRLMRLQNLERYTDLQLKYQRLQEENIALKATIEAQSLLIEQLNLRIEELERMVFGRRKKPSELSAPSSPLDSKPSRSSPRPSSSYQRATPAEEEVTSIEHHPLSACPDCGAILTRIKTVARYEEDLLPMTEWWKVLKRVTKHRITTGYCAHCHRRRSSVPISAHPVVLGANIKQFVSFGAVVLRLSYEQLRGFLSGAVRCSVSNGEISNILRHQATLLRPQFEHLKESIRSQPAAHYDETTWLVQTESQGSYAWVMTGTETSDTVFLLGRSRGKGNAEELKGPSEHVGVTDDYGAYKNLFQSHQLCWAHPHRKLRDLKDSTTLPEEKRLHCAAVYEEFATLYHDVEDACLEPFILSQRLAKKETLMKRFDAIAASHPLDPKKLQRIKMRLRERRDHYFVCLATAGIPLDNNKAERSLRHLVLKRKSSFGSRTQTGADMMSVLYSVLLSWWWKSKPSFFSEYASYINSS